MASTAIVLLTQRGHGENLLEAAAHYTGDSAAADAAVGLCGNESRDEIQSRLQAAVDGLGGRDALILCDLFGSTHANIAADMARGGKKLRCLCGLNLAMLIEAQTSRALPLDKAAAKAAAAGRRAVVVCGEKPPKNNAKKS